MASFEPRAHQVLLWTRLSGQSSSAWLIARDPGLTDIVARGTAATGPERDHTVVVDVEGLEPGTSYWYRFESGGERSPVGRTRTLPAGPVSRFRVGLVCCARYSVAPLTAYRVLAEHDVDLVLHLGDYIYEDDGHKGFRPHRPPRTTVTLHDYRQRLAQIREDPDGQALHLRHAMSAIWDDHDLADNAWRDGAKKHDPAEHGPWLARVQAAARARQEWLPARLRDPSDPLVTWRSFTVGELAELVLLDTRLTGRDRQAGDEGAKNLHDPTRSLLGDSQREWLRSRLADTSQSWAIVASGVVINPIALAVPGGALLGPVLPSGYSVLDGRLLHDDQWDGYPAERDRLTTELAERGRAGGRTVLLSGDVHSSWAFDGPCDDAGQTVAVEATIPSVSSAPMGRTRLPGGWRLIDAAARHLDHVRWADVTERGFGVLEVTPSSATVAWWFVDPYATDPAPGAELGAAFTVSHDQWPPQWQPAPAGGDEPPSAAQPELPPRPADVTSIRRRHEARRYGGLAALLTALGAAGAGVSRLVRHRRAG